ncbi:MAG: hypothetical protein U0703_10660 [Anaerolineae bacterium]
MGLGEGQRMRLQFDVAQEDDYLLYVAHMLQAASSSANTIQRAEALRPSTAAMPTGRRILPGSI